MIKIKIRNDVAGINFNNIDNNIELKKFLCKETPINDYQINKSNNKSHNTHLQNISIDSKQHNNKNYDKNLNKTYNDAYLYKLNNTNKNYDKNLNKTYNDAYLYKLNNTNKINKKLIFRHLDDKHMFNECYHIQ
jgi:hypothetical protein